MKALLILFVCLFTHGCANCEKIGDYRYKTSVNRVNIGEFDGLIFKYKRFVANESDEGFPLLIKAQKLDFETKNDTVFAYGDLNVIKEKDKVYIVTKEININGYENFINTDSVIRTYEQFKGGKVKFNEVIYYRRGQVTKKYIY